MIVYQFLNSVIFTLLNFFLACYIFLRTIKALALRNKLISEIEEYNAYVKQSRQSVDYVNESVHKVVKEIENDLVRELEITEHFTAFEEKLTPVVRKFAELQENALEYMRMNPNMRSIQISTPVDINEEVKQVLSRKKQETQTEPEKNTEINISPRKSLKKQSSFKYHPNHIVAGDQPKIPRLINDYKKRAPKYEERTEKPKEFFPDVQIMIKEKSEMRKQVTTNQTWVVEN